MGEDDGRIRCFGSGDPLYAAYHDTEWGRPVRDEPGLFERLCLEAFQSGLSWLTILRKRAAFRAAFAGFDPDAVARFGSGDVERLMTDAGIVRNRAKIEAAIANARVTVDLRGSGRSMRALMASTSSLRTSMVTPVWVTVPIAVMSARGLSCAVAPSVFTSPGSDCNAHPGITVCQPI